MAYKFQLGEARLSGSILPADDGIQHLGSSAKEWGDIYSDGTAYLDSINYNGVAITADANEINYSDITTLGTTQASKVVTADANGDITFAGASANIVFDKSANALEFVDNAKVTFGTGDDASIYWDGNSLEIGVESSATTINIGNTTSEVVIGDNLTVTGDLTIQGATTIVSSSTIHITSSFTFEGAGGVDDHQTVLGVTKPTADATINLPAMSAGTYHVPVLAVASTTAISATPEELNVLDGLAAGRILVGDGTGAASILNASANAQILIGNGTTLTSAAVSGDITISNSGVVTIAADSVEGTMLNDNAISGRLDIGADIVATDEILISDGGSLRKSDVSRLKTYVSGLDVYKLSGSGTPDGIIGAASGSGFYYNDAAETEEDGLPFESVYMISGSGWSAGDKIIIKAPQFDTGGKISIYAQSSSAGDFAHSIEMIQSDTSGSLMSQLGTDANDEPALVIESSNAAVTLVMWGIATDGGTDNYNWSII